jgi:hypothetical protein
MKIVMTLLARDEEDIVDAQLAFHLNAGVDFVIATDHASVDGTAEILRRYEREGHLRLVREDREGYRQGELVTRMAREAAAELGADWVINADADEFWWPRGANLKEVLRAIPSKYGVVQAFVRHFVPRPPDAPHFAERMTVRVCPQAPILDPTSAYRPVSLVMHRADPTVIVGGGNHVVHSSRLQPLRGWYPIEVLHFPWRSLEQAAHKAKLHWLWFQGQDRPPTGYHTRVFEALEAGTLDEWFQGTSIGGAELERGLASGTLVYDERLRDALRTLAREALLTHSPTFDFATEAESRLHFRAPTVVEDAEYAVDAAVLGEAEVVRAQKRLDELDARVATLERGLGPRVVRKIRLITRRDGGRHQ